MTMNINEVTKELFRLKSEQYRLAGIQDKLLKIESLESKVKAWKSKDGIGDLVLSYSDHTNKLVNCYYTPSENIVQKIKLLVAIDIQNEANKIKESLDESCN